MTFLLDHDVPDRVGDVLRQEGHSAIRLREVLPIESDDPSVLKHAGDHQLLLITCNRDHFLPLAESIPNHGIIVLIRRRSRIAECSAILKLVRKAGTDGLTGNVNFA